MLLQCKQRIISNNDCEWKKKWGRYDLALVWTATWLQTFKSPGIRFRLALRLLSYIYVCFSWANKYFQGWILGVNEHEDSMCERSDFRGCWSLQKHFKSSLDKYRLTSYGSNVTLGGEKVLGASFKKKQLAKIHHWTGGEKMLMRKNKQNLAGLLMFWFMYCIRALFLLPLVFPDLLLWVKISIEEVSGWN